MTTSRHGRRSAIESQPQQPQTGPAAEIGARQRARARRGVRACAAAMVAQLTLTHAPRSTAAVCTHTHKSTSPPPPPFATSLPAPLAAAAAASAAAMAFALWKTVGGSKLLLLPITGLVLGGTAASYGTYRVARSETMGNRSPLQTGRPTDELRAGCSAPPSLTAPMPVSFICCRLSPAAGPDPRWTWTLRSRAQ